jgi:hypothetical protein
MNMTTFNWNITQLNVYPKKDSKQDVVFTVHWTLEGVEDVEGEHTDSFYGLEYTKFIGSSYGSVGVTLEPNAPYTAYADLTKDQVLGWVWASVNKDEIEANVQAEIDKKKNPTVVTPILPWVIVDTQAEQITALEGTA